MIHLGSHPNEIPIPVFTQLPSLKDESDIDMAEHILKHGSNTDFVNASTRERKRFDQAELNDLVKDLGQAKELLETLASRLKDKNFPAKWYNGNKTYYSTMILFSVMVYQDCCMK